MVMCMLVIVAPPIVMGAWSMAFLLGQHVDSFNPPNSGTLNLHACTVLCRKRLECALFQSFVIFSVILHAMHTLNIPNL